MSFESAPSSLSEEELKALAEKEDSYGDIKPYLRETFRGANKEGRTPTKEELHDAKKEWWLNDPEGSAALEEELSDIRPELREYYKTAKLENISPNDVEGFKEAFEEVKEDSK